MYFVKEAIEKHKYCFVIKYNYILFKIKTTDQSNDATELH